MYKLDNRLPRSLFSELNSTLQDGMLILKFFGKIKLEEHEIIKQKRIKKVIFLLFII